MEARTRVADSIGTPLRWRPAWAGCKRTLRAAAARCRTYDPCHRRQGRSCGLVCHGGARPTHWADDHGARRCRSPASLLQGHFVVELVGHCKPVGAVESRGGTRGTRTRGVAHVHRTTCVICWPAAVGSDLAVSPSKKRFVLVRCLRGIVLCGAGRGRLLHNSPSRHAVGMNPVLPNVLHDQAVDVRRGLPRRP